jgi:hypothetical protein
MAWGLPFGSRTAGPEPEGGGGQAELGTLPLSPISAGEDVQDLETGDQSIAIFGSPAGGAELKARLDGGGRCGADENGRPLSASGAHRLAQPSLPAAHRPGTGAGSDRSRPSSGASRRTAARAPRARAHVPGDNPCSVLRLRVLSAPPDDEAGAHAGPRGAYSAQPAPRRNGQRGRSGAAGRPGRMAPTVAPRIRARAASRGGIFEQRRSESAQNSQKWAQSTKGRLAARGITRE